MGDFDVTGFDDDQLASLLERATKVAEDFEDRGLWARSIEAAEGYRDAVRWVSVVGGELQRRAGGLDRENWREGA